jgi:hypothetical protein
MCVDYLVANTNMGCERDQRLMAIYRTILAGLVVLAVALAPVGAALAANQALAKAAMEDCHGKASKDCQSCDTKAKCPDNACGAKCCKLVGMVALPTSMLLIAAVLDRPADPQKPPDRLLRPQPPPPRS